MYYIEIHIKHIFIHKIYVFYIYIYIIVYFTEYTYCQVCIFYV